MKAWKKLVVIALSSVAVSCGVASHPHTAILVDRFDADSCADAFLIRSAGKVETDGRSVTRLYAVDAECAEHLKIAFEELRFEESAADVFSYHSEQGWSETINIEQVETGKFAVRWQEFIT